MTSNKTEDEGRAEFDAMLSGEFRRLPFQLNLGGRRVKAKTSRIRVS